MSTTTTWEAMTEFGRNHWVARNVMGESEPDDAELTSAGWVSQQQVRCEDGSYAREYAETLWPPRYATDAAADYLVLERVRETWDADRLVSYSFALQQMLALRGRGDKPLVSYAMWYEPGDYSAAAFMALAQLAEAEKLREAAVAKFGGNGA